MTPMQEIRVEMANGDVAVAQLHYVGGAYQADFEYRSKIGMGFDPHSGPVTDAITAFDHMIGTLDGMSKVFISSISRVHNPVNAELLSIADQKAVLQKRGINVPVDMN